MQKLIIKAILLIFIITPIVSCTKIVGWQELRAGKKYARKSEYRNAIREFSDAIKKNPDYWKFYNYRGAVYAKLNEVDLAIADFTNSLKLIPQSDTWGGQLPNDDHALIYMRRGNLYYKKGSYELAINDYNVAIKLEPQFLKTLYFNRALANEERKQFLSAVEDYSKIMTNLNGFSDSEKIKTYLNRGGLYRKLNKFDLALADINQALKLDYNWQAYLSRGITYCKMGDFKKAISDLDNSVRLNPSNETAYLYKASIELITTCDLKKVLNNYFAVLKIEGIDEDTKQLTYNQIAWVLASAIDDNIRDEKKALLYAKKAVSLRPNCKNLDTLAVAFAGSGNSEKAITIHKEAINVCKSNNPELLPEVEAHLENYIQKQVVREKCPGAKVEKNRLREWRDSLYKNGRPKSGLEI
ncbi:MAG: tetratricopeptide repeat protein [Desulfobacteraceae bacterium]|nr:tetratricopeptide repeat protein [Desulfobacteraceae bacterium]